LHKKKFFSKENAALLNYFDKRIYRLHRNDWHKYNFSLINLAGWSDIHIYRPLFENWDKVRPVMEKLFAASEMAVCDRYYAVLNAM
jgi:hypothetical protein